MFRYILLLSLFYTGLLVPVFAIENDAIEKPSWEKQSAGTTLSLTSVTWDGSQFVAVGHKGLILISDDGISWFKADWGGNTMLTTIEHVEGLYPKFIVGGEGIILTSTDGKDWTVSIEDENKPFFVFDLVWGGGKIIAISMGFPSVMSSSNGTEWVNGKGPNMLSAAWGAGSYVGVGFMSSTSSSHNGVSWKNGTTGIQGALTSITYANDKFIAVGPRGLVATSPDGKVWSKSNSATNKGFADVIWNGRLAIAVGGQKPFGMADMMAGKKASSKATIAYSSDGIQWSIESFDDKYAFTSVAWSKQLEKFVAVGHGGLVYTGTFDGKKTNPMKPMENHGADAID